jgi:hypothetical protein
VLDERHTKFVVFQPAVDAAAPAGRAQGTVNYSYDET